MTGTLVVLSSGAPTKAYRRATAIAKSWNQYRQHDEKPERDDHDCYKVGPQPGAMIIFHVVGHFVPPCHRYEVFSVLCWWQFHGELSIRNLQSLQVFIGRILEFIFQLAVDAVIAD